MIDPRPLDVDAKPGDSRSRPLMWSQARNRWIATIILAYIYDQQDALIGYRVASPDGVQLVRCGQLRDPQDIPATMPAQPKPAPEAPERGRLEKVLDIGWRVAHWAGAIRPGVPLALLLLALAAPLQAQAVTVDSTVVRLEMVVGQDTTIVADTTIVDVLDSIPWLRIITTTTVVDTVFVRIEEAPDSVPPPPEPLDTLPTPPPDTLPTPRVFVVPGSIDPTGTEDVALELEAWIEGLGDSVTVELPAGAVYLVETGMVLDSLRSVEIIGNGARLEMRTTGDSIPRHPQTGQNAWPRTRGHVSCRGCTGFAIRDLVIFGPNAEGGTGNAAYVGRLEAQHGVECVETVGCEIDRVTISYVYGDGAYFGGRAGTDYGWVHDSHISYNGRQGIAIVDGDNLIIERNTITEIRRASIDLEPNTAADTIRNVIIRDNVFGPGRLRWIACGAGIGAIHGLLVENNTLDGKPLGMDCGSPNGARPQHRDFVIRGNVSNQSNAGPGGMGTTVEGVEGIVFEDNVGLVNWRRSMSVAGFIESCVTSIGGNQGHPGQEIRPREVDHSEWEIIDPTCGYPAQAVATDTVTQPGVSDLAVELLEVTEVTDTTRAGGQIVSIEDLLVVRFEVSTGASEVPTGPWYWELRVDGEVLHQGMRARLHPFDRITRTFRVPLASTVELVLDPLGAIPEADESNNAGVWRAGGS